MLHDVLRQVAKWGVVDRLTGADARLINYRGTYIRHVLRSEGHNMTMRISKLAMAKNRFFARMRELPIPS